MTFETIFKALKPDNFAFYLLSQIVSLSGELLVLFCSAYKTRKKSDDCIWISVSNYCVCL